MTSAFGATQRLITETRSAGVLANPATIALTIQLPDGTTAGPFTPVNDGTGLHHYDYTPTQAGRHIARWVTTGPAGADEEPFEVAALWAGAGVVSLGEAKKQLNMDEDVHDDDEEISGFIRAVTEICERYVGSLGRKIYVERQDGGYQIILNHFPVLSLTSVVAARSTGTDLAVSDLDLDGATGIIRLLSGGRMVGPYRITYMAGRTEIFPHVRQAALIIIQHMWETQRGLSGSVRVGGSDEIFDPRQTYSIPRRAQELLGDRPPVIA